MIVVKHEFLSNTEEYERIGSLYLMYAMFFKQPTKEYCKFRFTLEEWQVMTHFYNDISQNDQARLIFWKLLQADAFLFVEAEHEYGFERFMHKDHCKLVAAHKTDFKRFDHVIEDIVDRCEDTSTGIVTALDMLQANYNQAKRTIDVAGASSGLLPPTTIVDDIAASMRSVKKHFRIGTDYEECNKIMDELGDGSGKEAGDDSEDSDYARKNVLNIGSKRIKLKRKGFRSVAKSKPMPQLSNRCSVEDVGTALKIHKPKVIVYEPRGNASVMHQLTVSE